MTVLEYLVQKAVFTTKALLQNFAADHEGQEQAQDVG